MLESLFKYSLELPSLTFLLFILRKTNKDGSFVSDGALVDQYYQETGRRDSMFFKNLRALLKQRVIEKNHGRTKHVPGNVYTFIDKSLLDKRDLAKG